MIIRYSETNESRIEWQHRRGDEWKTAELHELIEAYERAAEPGDLISREEAIDALWKALYEYEDKTEKQFQESEELDGSDWIMNDRLWVQNGHNLCVNVLNNLPSAEKTGRWIWDPQNAAFICSSCGEVYRMGEDADAAIDWPDEAHYCMTCGARMEESSEYI